MTENQAWNPRKAVQVDCSQGGRVKQSFKDEANVNIIVRRNFGGKPPPFGMDPEAVYGDFSNVDDYHSGMNALLDAKASFMKLPPELRGRFRNDPGELLDFMNDPNNLEEAHDLGIINSPDVIAKREKEAAQAIADAAETDSPETVEPVSPTS